MIKNIIITLQALLILAGVLWFVSYKHIIEQTHLVGGLGFIANETRFISRVEKRLAEGQCDMAREILARMATTNINDMKVLIQQLDLSIPNQLGTARDYAEILHDVGIHEVSELIEQRAAQEDRASGGGA